MKLTFSFVFYFLFTIISGINFSHAGNVVKNEEAPLENKKSESTKVLADNLNATISGSSTVCLNSSPNPTVTFTATGGISPYTFTYQINGIIQNAIVTLGSNSSIQLSINTLAAGTFIYSLISVTDNSGRTQNQTGIATIKVNPLPDLTLNSSAEFSIVDGRPFFKVCSNMTAELTFTNTSATISTNANYSIDWGDGTSRFEASSWNSTKHIYAIGLWKMTYTIHSIDGCSSTKTVDVYVGSNPAVSLGSPGNTDNCSNYPMTFPITGANKNPPGTTYTISFNDGSPSQTYIHPPPAEITHVFTKSSCGVTSYNGTSPYPNSFSASIVASNMCGVTAVNVVPIYISTAPVVNFSLTTANVGTDKPITVTNTTTGYVNEGANCSVVPKMVWIITPSTGFTLKTGSLGNDYGQDNSNLWTKGTNVITPIFTVPGIYKIKLRVDTKRCGDDQIEKTICVEAPLKPEFILTTNSGCSPLEVSATDITNLSNNCTSIYKWTIEFVPGNCGNFPAVWNFINGTNSNSQHPKFKFETSGTYIINSSITNSAGTFVSKQTVIVKKPPTVSIESITDLCGNGSITPVGVVNSCAPESDNLTYEWHFEGGNPQTANTLNPGIITYNSLGSYKVILKVTNDCGSTTATSNTFVVHPIPVVEFVENQLKNNNQFSDEIIFSGNEIAVYEWVNDNQNIGLATFGRGNINPFILKNESNSVQTAKITVTPKNTETGCTGISKTFTITVNPTGDLNQPDDQTVSNKDNTTEIIFTTNSTGGNTVYKWVNDNSIIGLSSNGVGNVSSFVATNSSDEPIVASVAVTPYFENGGESSVGDSKTFLITVLPAAQVNPVDDIELCNGIKTPTIVFSSNRTIGTTTYSWTNNNPTIGLSSEGSGDILSFKVENKISDEKTAIITVIPTYTFNGISNTGEAKQFIIKVQPGAIITVQPQSSFICPGGFIEPLKVEYADGAGTPVYQWYWSKTNSNSSGTLISNATTNIYNPPTSLTGTTYYYCTISLPSGGCSNITSDVATISINDGAIIKKNPILLQNICVGGTIESPLEFEFTGGSGTPLYQWYINRTNSKNGGIAIPGAINSSYLPPVFTEPGSYYYYAELTLTGDGCGMISTNISQIYVVPDPIIENQPLVSQELCQDVDPTVLSVKASGGLGTYQYQWFINTVNDNSSGSPIRDANNNSFLPTTQSIGIAYYYCVISQSNGLNCNVTSLTAAVIVNPIPVITEQPKSVTICLGEVSDTLAVSYQYGVGTPTYQWYSNSVHSNQSGTIIIGADKKQYIPVNLNVGITYFYCVLSFSTGGYSNLVSTVAAISVLPVPVISSRIITVCNGSEIKILPDNSNGDVVPEGTTYTWSKLVISPAGSLNGINIQSSPVSLISQKLYNLTDSVATAIYTISPVSGSCVGEDFAVEIRVVPTIKVNEIVNNVNCYGANNGSILTNITGGAPLNSTHPFSILWTGPNGFTANTKDILNLLPGEYTVSISDASDCQTEYSYTITQPAEIEINTIIKNDLTCLNSGNGQLSVSINGGTAPYNYVWTKNSLPFATTRDLSNLSAGNYELIVADSKGCKSKTTSYTISEPSEITIKLLNQTNINCFGERTGAISIDVQGGTPLEIETGIFSYNFSWTGPTNFVSNDKNLNNLVAGIYLLTVADKNLCTKTIQVAITQPTILNVNVNTSPVTCYGSKNASISLDITGGSKPYKIQWSNFGSGTTQDNLSPGDYWATVTDANNCQKTVSCVILEANFAIHPLVKNVSGFGANDGSISLNITGGLNPVSLIWSDSPTAGDQRNQLKPGVYTVTLTDGAPCQITKSFVITEPQPIQIIARITNAFDCENQNSGAIDLTVSGASAPFNYSWSNGSSNEDLVNILPGIYSVEVTDASGFKKTAQFEIIRQMPLTVSVTSKTRLDCDAKQLKIQYTSKISGGFSPYHINWNKGNVSGKNNETMEINQNTVVSMLVTDSLGCSANYMFNVNIPRIGIEYSIIDCNKYNYKFIASDPHDDAFKYTYSWDFGDGEIAKGLTIQHKYQKTGIYKVQLSVSDGTCQTTFEKVINVESISKMTFDREPKYCEGESTILYVSGAYTYKWSDGSAGDSIIITKVGEYSVIGTSNEGCKDTLYFSTSSYDLFKYNILSENEHLVTDGSETVLWSEYIPYTQYNWDFGDGSVGQGNKVYHIFKNNSNGYYDLKLKVVNPNGCTETATRRIWITIPELPNTFSPNGDGINDYFLQNWQLKVYNRNGAILYEGYEGWDGNHNGKPVTNDIYFYVVYYPSESGTKTKPGYVRIIR
ncbi:MAG: PKD domain-containing protein [Paludibacter sp.]|nr:PKD domain-containing protein [Paludibacter sp.]